MSIGDQLDIDDIFPLFARRRLVAAIDGQAHVADRHSCLLDGSGLRIASQIAHEKDFVEVRHNWCAPTFEMFPYLYHNIKNENFLPWRRILPVVALQKKNTLENSFFKKNARNNICINEKSIYLYCVNRRQSISMPYMKCKKCHLPGLMDFIDEWHSIREMGGTGPVGGAKEELL